MEAPDFFVRPPETVNGPYEGVVNDYLWYSPFPTRKVPTKTREELKDDPIWSMGDGNPYRDAMPGLHQLFCTDGEAAKLSGVPERSLRTLQTAGIIAASRAPMLSGGFKRMWHLPEVAAAAAVECMKRATGFDYKTAGAVMHQSAVYAKLAFFYYAKLGINGYPDYFDADIIFAEGKVFALSVSDGLIGACEIFRLLAEGKNLIPVAVIEDGKVVGLIDRDTPTANRKATRILVKYARFRTTVSLKQVFWNFEHVARELRPQATDGPL